MTVTTTRTDPLLRDLVEWVSRSPRRYDDVMEAWRTSCPAPDDLGRCRRAGSRLARVRAGRRRYGVRDRQGARLRARCRRRLEARAIAAEA